MESKLEVTRRTVKIEKPVVRTEREINLENEIEFPCEVSEIQYTGVQIDNLVCEAGDGKIVCRGSLHKHIKWVAGKGALNYEPGKMYEDEFEEELSEVLAVPGVASGKEVLVTARVGEVDNIPLSEEGTDGKVWRQVIRLDLFFTVVQKDDIEIVTDVSHPQQNLNVSTEDIKLKSVLGEGQGEEKIAMDFELEPPALEITRVAAWLKDVCAESDHDHVQIKGKVKFEAEYTSVEGEEEPRIVEGHREFQTEVVVPGTEKGMEVRVIAEVIDAESSYIEGEEHGGYTKARLECALKTKVDVTQILNVPVVTSIEGEKVEASYKYIELEKVVSETGGEQSLINQIEIGFPVKEVFSERARLDLTGSAYAGEIRLEGFLSRRLRCTGLCDGSTHREAIPDHFFSFDLEAEEVTPEMRVEVKGILESLDYELPSYPEQICEIFKYGNFIPAEFPCKETALIRANVRVLNFSEVKVLGEVREAVTEEITGDAFAKEDYKESAESKKGAPEKDFKTVSITKQSFKEGIIKYYQAKPGETLWEIAQRYGITVEAIKSFNPDLEEESLSEAKWIRIPAKN